MESLQITYKQYMEEMNPFIVRQMGYLAKLRADKQKSDEALGQFRGGAPAKGKMRVPV